MAKQKVIYNLKDVMAELEELGNEKMRKQNTKHGATGDQFGVRRGELKKLAKKIKINHELALELWATKNIDARFLAIHLFNTQELSKKEIDKMVKSEKFVEVGDWLMSYVIKLHPDSEELRLKWMQDKNPMAARAGWSLTSQRVRKSPEILDLNSILDRLESEMGEAPSEAQWTMNFALAEIGINIPKHRKRALAIGEKLGVYREYPTTKGCTSPFAPIWINEMVSRQG